MTKHCVLIRTGRPFVLNMASRTELSEFESSSKRRKYDSSDADDSDICPENDYGQYSTSSESQFDACEGVSTDSGFNEVPQYDTESQESTQSYPASPNPLQESISDSQIDRIMAMRGVIDDTLWRELVLQLLSPPPRQRLLHISKLSDVVRLIRNSRNIMVLTGAGVSVSCGIPDFRSRDGIYARLAQDFPDLPDPHAMFDSAYFRQDPRPFFKFAREIYPGRFSPSPCHRFIKTLEIHGRLLRNYTQNIDTLERAAGISQVIECHGSFARATCTRCERSVHADQIRDDIFAQRIPVCEICNPGVTSVSASENVNYTELVAKGVMKPNIVFFGEGLPKKFHKCIRTDRQICDLLLVIGSSLKVRPVAEIPSSLPQHVPQVLINRERLPHCTFDVELLGDSDVIINQICNMLGDSWKDVCCFPALERASRLIFPDYFKKYCEEFGSEFESDTYLSSDSSNLGSEIFPTESCSESESLERTLLCEQNHMKSEEKCNNFSTMNSSNINEIQTKACTSFTNNSLITLNNSFIDNDTSSQSNNVDNSQKSHVRNNTQFSNSMENHKVSVEQNTHNTCTLEEISISSKSCCKSSFSLHRTNNTNFEHCLTVPTVSQMGSTSRFLISDHTNINLNSTNVCSQLSNSIENLSETIHNQHSITDEAQIAERHNSIDSACDLEISEELTDSHSKINLSECLPSNTYYYKRPNMYIFPGAEIKLKRKYLKCFR